MGWVFPASDKELAGAEPDHLNGAKSIRELYELASTKYTGKYTVPVCSLLLSGLFIILSFFSFSLLAALSFFLMCFTI